MTVKLAIVYYSSYGTNHQMALIAAEAAKAAGAEVRLLKAPETAPEKVVAGVDAWKAHAEKTADIPNATAEDMEWANAYLISAGTRFGVMASQMRAFIDTLGGVWGKGGLANKPVSAMTSAQNTHGGQETTLVSFYTTVMHWGGIVVAPGYTDEVIFKTGGNPYGYSHTQGDEFTEEVKTAISHQARRLVDIAGKLN
ncbi:NAD(P)H:quinone oxidoreductase type IV [Oceaniovalibus sp. ACAM 378]|uniref:NAD(P)H:quinone oxidoreductase type IV n=1 Tax=Oceaniovalibus sp. ACAM 378 TaxID=2599923 RepID=UPI0011D40E7D|nr:NAD(P)H:quinone oxidoreductase type IV [Oceaniovalibus sp. ACAM 378]TYB85346.1 NAD(P)H:quinone oxidoreductase type IV [Oceaniovalibus sp. ACAM 378]